MMDRAPLADILPEPMCGSHPTNRCPCWRKLESLDVVGPVRGGTTEWIDGIVVVLNRASHGSRWIAAREVQTRMLSVSTDSRRGGTGPIDPPQSRIRPGNLDERPGNGRREPSTSPPGATVSPSCRARMGNIASVRNDA